MSQPSQVSINVLSSDAQKRVPIDTSDEIQVQLDDGSMEEAKSKSVFEETRKE